MPVQVVVLVVVVVAWHSGRTPLSDRRTFPVPCSTCSWRVTTYVGKTSAAGQPTQLFILSGSINWMCRAIRWMFTRLSRCG